MTLTEVQAQAAMLNVEQRRKLAAFLATLRMKETGEWDRDTRGRGSWISFDDANRRLLSEG